MIKKLIVIALPIFLNNCSSINTSKDNLENTAIITSNGTEMIKVDGGTFEMGSEDGGSDEVPVHKVTLSSFYIGKYEITEDDYRLLVGFVPSPAYKSDYTSGPNYPAVYVSWYDAIKFCNLKSKKENLAASYDEKTGDLLDEKGNVTADITKVKGYRLPTEAEWEYAARGGNKSQNFQYSGSNNIDEVAWYSKNADYQTHDVGTKKANELGIYDMTGNVAEWCQDWFNSNNLTTEEQDSYSKPNDNQNSYKIFRGGRIEIPSNLYDTHKELYNSFRAYTGYGTRKNSLGFRIVKSY